MRLYNTDFMNYGKDLSLRSDFNYQELMKELVTSNEETYSFNDVFDVVNDKVKSNDLNDDFYYCQIGDVTSTGDANPVLLNFEKRELELEPYYKKIEKGDIMRVKKNDILISFLIPYTVENKGKFLLIDNSNSMNYYSTAFINLRPKIYPEAIYYILKSLFYKYIFASGRIGKGYTGYATLNAEDLYKIRFPKRIIDNIIKNENKIKDVYTQYNKKINELKGQTEEQQYIVNDVFSNFFNYKKSLINDVHKGMTFGTQKDGNTKIHIENIDFSNIDDTKSRLSIRANNSIVRTVEELIKQHGTIKLQDIIKKEIRRGKSPQYDKDGTIPVIKTAHITNNGISSDFSEFVNEEFYYKKEDAHLKIGDLLLTSTGKPSIGKIDIIENDDKAIPDGHVSIIRINEKKYNPKFLLYFIRSVLGYVQIEKEFVGCTNQIELYPNSINDIILPDIDKSMQDRLVKEIEEKIQAQNIIRQNISIYQDELESAITKIII